MAGFPSAVLVLLLCVVAVCSSVPVGAWWPQTPTSLLRTPTIRACVTSNERTLPLVHDVTGGRPPIEWYPGHIPKAERLMSEVLKMVDVVVELRDARIPHSTAHPLLDDWLGSRRHVKPPFLPYVGARSRSVFSHIPGTEFSTCCSCFGRFSLISALAPSPASWKNVMRRSFLKKKQIKM